MADVQEFLTESDVGVSRVARPGRGEVTYPDQLIMDRSDLSVTTVSNKSRDFRARVHDYTQAELEPLRDQARRDVEELFDKYAAGLHIRRPSHPLYLRHVNVTEVILVYENERGPVDRELADIVMQVARTEAHRINPGIDFHVTFQ